MFNAHAQVKEILWQSLDILARKLDTLQGGVQNAVNPQHDGGYDAYA